MSDVIHDPNTDRCACEPNSPDRCAYRMLADQVVDKLSPPDSLDWDEMSLCLAAIDRVAIYVNALPCECAAGDAGEPCDRCEALGQRHRKPTQS